MLNLMKLIRTTLMLAILVFALPAAVFADAQPKPGTYPTHIRVPVTLTPITESNSTDSSMSTLTATPIDGYLDIWSDVSGKTVDANWTVTITTPKTFITYVNLQLKMGFRRVS